jgi:hypothetical protein
MKKMKNYNEESLLIIYYIDINYWLFNILVIF